jgi:hypothetical protein
MIIGILAWYVVGIIGAAMALRSVDPSITVADAIVILVAGICGPITFLYYLQYSKNSWLNKRLF